MYTHVVHIILSRYNISMTIKEKIILKLKHDISSTKQKLPSEKDLSHEFDCSRSTVRNALHSLVDQGYLVAKKGIGYFKNEQLQSNKIKPFKEAIRIKTHSKIENIDIKLVKVNKFNISKGLTYRKKRYHNKKLIEISNIIINKHLISKFNVNVASESLVEYLTYDQGIKLSVEKNHKKAIKNKYPQIHTTCDYLIFSNSIYLNEYDEVVCIIESFLAVEYFEIQTNYYG